MSALRHEDIDVAKLAQLLAGGFNEDESINVPAEFKFHSSIALIFYSGYLIKTVVNNLYRTPKLSEHNVIKNILDSEPKIIPSLINILFNNTNYFQIAVDKAQRSSQLGILRFSDQTFYERFAEFLNDKEIFKGKKIDELGNLIEIKPNYQTNSSISSHNFIKKNGDIDGYELYFALGDFLESGNNKIDPEQKSQLKINYNSLKSDIEEKIPTKINNANYLESILVYLKRHKINIYEIT